MEFPEFAGLGVVRKKISKKKSKSIMVPIEFLEIVEIKSITEGYPNRNDFLRAIAKDWRPTIKELKDRGLLSDDEE